MSDKLAISAAVSVFMMTAFVLFGGEAAQAPFGPRGLDSAGSLSAPTLPGSFDAKALLR